MSTFFIGTGFRRREGANRRSFRYIPNIGGWAVGEYPPDCHIFVECYHSAQSSFAFCRECWSFSKIRGFCFWASSKTHLLRFERIFCPSLSLRKLRNTQSIPKLPQRNLSQNLSLNSSKMRFRRCRFERNPKFQKRKEREK